MFPNILIFCKPQLKRAKKQISIDISSVYILWKYSLFCICIPLFLFFKFFFPYSSLPFSVAILLEKEESKGKFLSINSCQNKAELLHLRS